MELMTKKLGKYMSHVETLVTNHKYNQILNKCN